MAARRAGQKVFDWTKMNSLLPDYLRTDFLKFRGHYETRKAKMNALPAQPVAVDWSYYKTHIAKTGLVESFQKQYDALKVPYPQDTTSSSIAEKEKKTEIEVQEAVREAKMKAEELRKELAVINSQIDFDDMTVDDYLKDKPALRKKIDQDTKNHVWYLG